MTDNRITWIDNLKALGIFLVVLAHHENDLPNYLLKYIYSFHVPLFFFASGLVFNPDKYTSIKILLIDKVRSLLIPYFVFSFLTYLFWLILNVTRGYVAIGSSDMILPLIGIFYSSNWIWMTHNPPLWFLTCLFVVEVEFYLLYQYSRKVHVSGALVLCLLLALSISGSIMSRYFLFRLPWGLDISITALPLFGIAFYAKPILFKLLKRDNLPAFRTLIPLLIFLLSISIFVSSAGDFVNMGCNRVHDYFHFIVAGIAGVLSCCIISAIIPRNRILTFIGANTIIILAFHLPAWSFMRGIQLALSKIHWDLLQSSIIVNTIYSLIQIMLTVPIILFVNRYLPLIIKHDSPRGLHFNKLS